MDNEEKGSKKEVRGKLKSGGLDPDAAWELGRKLK